MIAWDDDFCSALAARGFYVVRFDNRDAGLSTNFDAWGDPNPLVVFDELRKKRPVTPPYRLADMADDAVALLDALDLPAAHVVGVSMGGMIAQELAIRHPERVLSLTSIMSTTGALDVRGPSYETMAALLAPFPSDRHGFIVRSVELAHTLHGPGFPFEDARVRRVASRSFDRAYRPGGVRRQLIAIWLSGDRTPALKTLRVPALVMHGDADPLVPVDGGQATARAIPGARLDIIPGMGHELPRPVWPRVIDAVTALAAGARPTP
jgi:pimeloyl-ACP methyl ester carboxylesterase